jgi:signal transduction histidine kinase/ligand-binding sensor domain-containing protein
MRFLWIILLLPFFRFNAEASSGVMVRVWQSQDGLPGNVVRSVVQSSDGYLWVATAEGVARFDGFDFELIDPGNDLEQQRLAYSRLFATAGGDVWAATYQGGLFRVSQSGLQVILRDRRRPNPPLVTHLTQLPSGEVWFRRGDETGRIVPDGTVVDAEPSAEVVAWMENEESQAEFNGRIRDGGLLPVLRDGKGRLWTVGADGGLTITEENQAPISVEFPQRGRSFGINEMLLDREGNVWVASPVNGLARIRHARVDLPLSDADSDSFFSALLQERSGVWWIANRKGGVVRWTPEESRNFLFGTPQSFRPAAALFEDRDSKLWLASRDGSVFKLEDGVFQPQFSKTQIPSKVRSITQDADGTLWFGGAQGLSSYAAGVVRQFGVAEGIGALDFTILQPFPGGGIIGGTRQGKVLLGGPSHFATIADSADLDHRWISGILVVSEKEVWVSTVGSGLFLWDGDSWFGFGNKAGIPDTRLTCVLLDDDNHLWLGSLGGIIRAERGELLTRARHDDAVIHWLRLDHTDGLPSRECIGGFQPAGWRADDGMLWFPTGGGVVRVRPGLVERNRVPPSVYLQSVRANGIPHADHQTPVTTGPGRARLEFRFVGLSFSAPDKTTYRARLKGLDDSWRELGNQRVAAFEAVPPGRYTFEVAAANGDGIRSPEPARIGVFVKPHLWETAWFYLTSGTLLLTGAAGVGWYLARLRLKRRIQELKIRNAREAERARIARDLHDDLGASLTEISILAALAAEDAEQTALHPSLDQLSAKAKHVVGSLDEIVWAVNPREDTLRSLVDYLAAFAREFLDIARIPMRVDVGDDIPDHTLPASRRHCVFLAAREALNNIVKHSEATEVMLWIAVSDETLEIRIADNGRGFEPDYAIGGNGLGNLRTRMQEAGGDCRIDTSRKRGTTVFLTLPLQVTTKPVS